MVTNNPRGRVAGRVFAAHVFGLSITGIAGTIGTTAGFSIEGAGLGLWLGGLLSVPWVVVVGLLVWWRGGLIDRHPFAFATIGPVVVIASWGVVTGATFEKTVVISAVASSIFYLCAIGAEHWLSSRHRMRGDQTFTSKSL